MGAINYIHDDADPASRTILVVEDEVLIRLAIADFLRGSGFQVVEAANADEAVTILNTRLDVHLVFTDVQMPGSMNGLDLARWTLEARPSMAVIVTSGRIGTDTLEADLAAIGPVEAKPYSETALLRRIRERLGLAETD
jgi:CheY-like chemotaxis protein